MVFVNDDKKMFFSSALIRKYLLWRQPQRKQTNKQKTVI